MKGLSHAQIAWAGMALCAGVCLLISACAKLLEPGGSTLDDARVTSSTSIDQRGYLFDTTWMGKVRIFYDPADEQGLVLFWIPKIEKIQPGTALKTGYCPTEDGYQYDANWSVPLNIALLDSTHDWKDPIAQFFPESEFQSQDDMRFDSATACAKTQSTESFNPKPCSAFPLYNPNFENRERFKYNHITPGTQLVVLVAQPILRAADIYNRFKQEMFGKVQDVWFPNCLSQQGPADPEASLKDYLFNNDYLRREEPGNAPVYRFTLNMYHQLTGCQKWYAKVGITPIEINITQDIIQSLDDDALREVRDFAYHPKVSGKVCESLGQLRGR